MFRRNCDLRRHTLTHAVGDVPSDVLDVGDDKRQHLSGDEESVLEVDSPDHSPVRRPRLTPSTASSEKGVGGGGSGGTYRPGSRQSVHELDRDDLDDDDEEEPPLPIMREYVDSSGVTHCHHQGPSGSQSPYTMRPSNERDYIRATTMQHHNFKLNQAAAAAAAAAASGSDSYVPLLHVRRDLHHKHPSLSSLGAAAASATVTSGILEPGPSFLGSMPFRKRPLPSDDGPPRSMIDRYASHGGHIRHHNLAGMARILNHPGDIIMPPILGGEPPIEPLALNQIIPKASPLSTLPTPSVQSNQVSTLSPPSHSQPSALPLPTPSVVGGGPVQQPPSTSAPQHPPPTQQQQQHLQPQPPPPRRTGFTIEDIMRR